MLFLKIQFTWQPLYLTNISSNFEAWGYGTLFLVYGGVPLSFFIIGLVFSYYLHSIQDLNWRARILLTWLSFFLVNTLIAGMIASLFTFDGVGVVFVWIFPSYFIRIFIGVIAILILLLSRPYWQNLFFKAIYSKSILMEIETMEDYRKQTMVYPWVLSVPFLVLFSFISGKWYWALSIIFMGLIIFGFMWYIPVNSRIRIIKENTTPVSLKVHLLFFVSLLLFMYLGGLLIHVSN